MMFQASFNQHMNGLHTSENIKKQYDFILEMYNIKDKTVADQAANMKKVLKDVLESTTIECGASDDNIQYLTQLLLDRKKKYNLIQSEKDKQEVIVLNKEIDAFNKVSKIGGQSKNIRDNMETKTKNKEKLNKDLN
jgi:hypothetical protein